MDYVARYTQSAQSTTVDMRLDATTDEDAVAEVRKIVEEGYRNETSAMVELSDGRFYAAANQHGVAHGHYA